MLAAMARSILIAKAATRRPRGTPTGRAMPPERFRIHAVLLAAGESRRMGGPNKLLLRVGGEPLVRRTARTLLSSGLDGVTAVTGHDGEAVAAALAGLPLTIVPNPDYAAGQMTSVRAGMLALPATDAVLVCPADMPALTPR